MKANLRLADALTGSPAAGFSRNPQRFTSAMTEYVGGDELYDSGSLVSLMADALEIGELRTCVEGVIGHHWNDFKARIFVGDQFVGKSPASVAETLDLAHCINVLLLCSDSTLIRALNEVTSDRRISLGSFAVKTARLQRHSRGNCIAELGRYGVRFRPDRDTSFLARQLAHFFRILCNSGSFDAADLAFALNQPEDVELPALLDMVYRAENPVSLVDAVIMGNRRALAETTKLFHINETERGEVRSRILWRLGLESGRETGDLQRLLSRLPEVDELMAGGSQERLRGFLAMSFPLLETILKESLEFAAWALTTDHFASSDSFCFDAKLASENLAESIDAHGRDSEQIWRDGEIPAIHQLGSGFGRLAKVLERKFDALSPRPEEDWPTRTRTGIQPFAFKLPFAYCNLDLESRSRIIKSLRRCAALGCDRRLTGVRNSALHGNNMFPSNEEIAQCIQLMRELLDLLNREGFYPVVRSRKMLKTDALGRRWAIYEGASQTIEVPANSWSLAAKMPRAPQEAVVMPSAKNDQWGPLRFTLLPNKGPETYWGGWPVVWHDRGQFAEVSEDGSVSNEDSGLEEG